MAFDREAIEGWLASPGSGYPGSDAMAMSDDYSRMGEEERGWVRDVLREWLHSRDQHLHMALWFLAWAQVARFDELEPDLLDLSEWLATQPIPEWGNIMTQCGTALADLGSRQVIPALKRWAESVGSPDHFTAGIAEHSAGILLQIDKQEGLAFAPAILRADLKFRAKNFPSPGKRGRIIFSDHFMFMYMRRYPAEARDLGLAYRNMQRAERAASLVVFEQVVAERVRVEKIPPPQYSLLVPQGVMTLPDDWGAEALASFKVGLGPAGLPG